MENSSVSARVATTSAAMFRRRPKAKTDAVAKSPIYQMRISRMTVDKLGVRLYDTVSAVVAELIANGYDADARSVTVSVPMATSLAKRRISTRGNSGRKEIKQPSVPDHRWEDLGYVVEVIDDGHGMTREEANEHFLQVGRERRKHHAQGARSRKLKRPVMGRKGIGKLAPFGICRKIEVISAGGKKTAKGHVVSHFVMDYDRILADDDKPVPLDPGERDGSFQKKPGTIVRLSSFLGKRVPEPDVFLRQLARRFTPTVGFKIHVTDTRRGKLPKGAKRNHVVGPLDVPIQTSTRIDLSKRPVITETKKRLKVTGWLALAKDAYKDEETAGVRIYARNKIVGWTRDFEQPAGYTGEFTMRSYLVGEVTAEWLDLDRGEDLVKTDRQGIIWDSEYGNAFREWGAALIKEMGATSRAPRRARVQGLFLTLSNINERAKKQYGDAAVVDAAVDLAKKIGGFAAEDELTDESYVEDLSSVILSVAPHTALMKAFQEFEKLSSVGRVEIGKMQTLFRRSRVAELASYGQIAHERVRVIEKLETIVRAKTDEAEFQKLLASAPWLVEPTWSIISENQGLRSFKLNFERWFEEHYNRKILLAIHYEKKRPDFTLVEVGHQLHIVEIKPAGHSFNDTDAERLLNYADAFDKFFEQHGEIRAAFSQNYLITLVSDSEKLSKPSISRAFNSLKTDRKLRRMTWTDFLTRARNSHEEFLSAAQAFRDLERDGHS